MSPTGPELIGSIRARIREVDPAAADRMRSQGALVLDVREADELWSGSVPDAVHVPRGLLESQIDDLAPDRGAPLIVYCASGNRSALAVDTLARQLGYEQVFSLAGGIGAWRAAGLEIALPAGLTTEQRERYARHLSIAEVGEAGQRRLLESRVLLLGAGGLGSPVALYLAAAGVGTIAVVDHDVVERSNLQRQVLHSTDRIGARKVASAEQSIRALNPDVEVIAHAVKLDEDNAVELMQGYDVVVDGLDNFRARYAVNDVAVRLGVPVVSASVSGFDGQLAVFDATRGPCYRCLFPTPPPAGVAPTCGEVGVLGVVPGTLGLLQATETIKLLLEIGEPLIGRLVIHDALGGTFTEVRFARDPDCEACGRRSSDADARVEIRVVSS